MRYNRRYRNITAAVLAAVLAAGTSCIPLQAKAPAVEIDETMYVNMGYYGEIDDISVVKGCFLNGNTLIEDYGDYDEVINMSNRITPAEEDGKLTWDLTDAEDKAYFYYECKSDSLKEKVPWDIDVSYRLNGVEARGEELGGASGMVTTLIHVTPKQEIEEYYQNNMLLMCGTIVDMKDTLSIEAPGAQLQTLGTEKAVIFLTLPGEESEFRVDIGSNAYESMGVFFMMVPATLDSLEIVNDIRDVRDTVEDSVDAMDNALDVILDNVSDMRDDLADVEEGLKQAQEAHQIYDDNRESMEADADAAISSLQNMVTYLEVINTQTQADQDNLDETIDRLYHLMNSIGGLNKFGTDLSNNLNGLSGSLETLQKLSEGTITQEGIEQLQQLVGMSGSSGSSTVTVEAVARQAALEAMAEKLDMSVSVLQAILQNTNSEQYASLAPVFAAATKEAIEKMGYDPDSDADKEIEITNPSGTDVGLKSLLTTYISTLKNVDVEAGDSISASVANTRGLLSTANSAMSQLDYMAESAQNMAKWLDGTMREDIRTLTEQLSDLVSATEMTLSATQAALSSIRGTMEVTEDTLSSSLTLTLNGLTGVMHSGVGVADGVDIMRDAKNTVKDAVDDELDELDNEHHFLNMDVTQDFPSFTSPKNPSPSSIQIIMRTAEISADEDTDNVTDIEVPREDIGVWGRFKAVFVKLWNTITGWFR